MLHFLHNPRSWLECVRILGSKDPLGYWQQGGELIPGGGWIPRLPDGVSEFALGSQGTRMLRVGRE
jgi:hypothetical protein